MKLPYSNLQISHQNPGASMPLVLPIHVICNTSDEQLFDNIRVNSRRPGKWQKLIPAHKGVAVLCGSGPSLADNLEVIRELQEEGCAVFAMNGAAKFLSDNGILPDFQVMIDARPETAQLVGPAKVHLFGSQVHPDCWLKAPDALLWHLQIGGIEELFPAYSDDYCLIGGAASVGNCATCLAFAMGYRILHCYGYDSSHRGNAGHAFTQPLNDGDPCCFVKFAGKDYRASLTMKLQAEKFLETSAALVASGCEVHVHGDGLLPAMWNTKDLTEQQKYELLWTDPDYRTYSPGEQVAKIFANVARPQGTVIDFGCGTGRGALALKQETHCNLLLVDFTENSRDPAAQELPFIQKDLTQPMFLSGDYGYCTDVMEHIQPELVEAVIHNILQCTPIVFFQISLVPDAFGETIGQTLHLSVHPLSWWYDLFNHLGYHVLWNRDQGDSALFLVSVD